MKTMVPVVSMTNVVHVGSSEIRRTVIYDVTGEYICSDCGKIEAFEKRIEVALFYMTHAGRSFADAVKDELGPPPTCTCSLQRKGRCVIPAKQSEDTPQALAHLRDSQRITSDDLASALQLVLDSNFSASSVECAHYILGRYRGEAEFRKEVMQK